MFDEARASAVKVTGWGLILMAALSAYAAPVVEKAAPDGGWFRLAVVAWLVIAALDVIVAWSLFLLLGHVDPALSALAAILRVTYAAGLLVAITRLTGDAPDLDGFHQVWDTALFLFGLHLALVGLLVWRSPLMPRWLGALVALAGFGYAFDAVTGVLTAGDAAQIGVVTFVGELVLAIWLVSVMARRTR